LLIPAATCAAGRPAVAVAGGGVADGGDGLAAGGVAGPAGRGVTDGPRRAAGRAADADAVLQRVRSACHAAVADLVRTEPDLIVVVGGAATSRTYDGSSAGSLSEFGIPFTTGSGQPVLPLSLTVGAWLLRRALAGGGPGGRPQTVPRLRLLAVARDTPAAACLQLGAELARQAQRVAVLAMGDASARKAAGIPGAPDPAAEHYDADVAAALAAAEPGRLAGLDPALDDELKIAGRAAWQVLAGAGAGGRLRGMLRCAAAPFDVSYLVASWECLPGHALTH
jgi:hypothetical protein